MPLSAHQAHVYTECADIWNPIHTERGFAQDAGLPDPILHGSCTFAFSVRELMRRYLDNDPERLRRVAGQFRSIVMLGDPITVQAMGESRDGDQPRRLLGDAQRAGRPRRRERRARLRRLSR